MKKLWKTSDEKGSSKNNLQYFVCELILSCYDSDFNPWFNLFNLRFKSNQ